LRDLYKEPAPLPLRVRILRYGAPVKTGKE
jgi:hypothetical protein